MRKLLASILLAAAVTGSAPVLAADLPPPPPYYPPPPDYDLGGSFYLRGSAAFNALWTREHVFTCDPVCEVNEATAFGYGYSFGGGIGYETGDGLRFDFTGDYIYNYGLTDGTESLEFQAGLALANAYYDFAFSNDYGTAAGGFGGYVGAGIGGAYYTTHVVGPDPDPADGTGFTPAVAAMAGVTYDAGDWVGDIGYRIVYMPTITNGQADQYPFYLNDNTLQEIRGTVRYRF
jgi:hypothetical protein